MHGDLVRMAGSQPQDRERTKNMKLKHAIIGNYTGERRNAVLCPPNQATVINGADHSGRRVLHAIACSLAIYRDPTRTHPSKGWTKGQIDPPELQPPDAGADQPASGSQQAKPASTQDPATVLIETANGSRWKRWVADSGRTETLVETLAKGDERTAIIALGITPHVDEYFDGLDHQPGAKREHSPNQYTKTQDPPPTVDEILERIHKRIENAFRDTDPSTERSAILLLDSTEFEWNHDEFGNFLARVARESPETQVIAYRPPR